MPLCTFACQPLCNFSCRGAPAEPGIRFLCIGRSGETASTTRSTFLGSSTSPRMIWLQCYRRCASTRYELLNTCDSSPLMSVAEKAPQRCRYYCAYDSLKLFTTLRMPAATAYSLGPKPPFESSVQRKLKPVEHHQHSMVTVVNSRYVQRRYSLEMGSKSYSQHSKDVQLSRTP